MQTLDPRMLIPINSDQLSNEELDHLIDKLAQELERSSAIHREWLRLRLERATRSMKERREPVADGEGS